MTKSEFRKQFQSGDKITHDNLPCKYIEIVSIHSKYFYGTDENEKLRKFLLQSDFNWRKVL